MKEKITQHKIRKCILLEKTHEEYQWAIICDDIEVRFNTTYSLVNKKGDYDYAQFALHISKEKVWLWFEGKGQPVFRNTFPLTPLSDDDRAKVMGSLL